MSSEPNWHVVRNDQGQYSIWRDGRPVPLGWISVLQATKPECLQHIERVWNDIRPRRSR